MRLAGQCPALRKVQRTRRLVIGMIMPAFFVCQVNLALAQEDPKTLIAEQVRLQQHDCGTPIEAVRDEALSKPDAAVWILTCDNAKYRVRLHPDMAADIEKL